MEQTLANLAAAALTASICGHDQRCNVTGTGTGTGASHALVQLHESHCQLINRGFHDPRSESGSVR